MTMRVALGLRGHIRNGLTDSGLRAFVYKLAHARNIELDIYCHTWKEHEAKSSYRELDRSCLLKVNSELISHYFASGLEGPLHQRICDITVQDDSKLKLNGNLEGVVCDSKIPRVAWKRMWAGQMQLLDTIANSNKPYDVVINTRYDMFTSPICKTSSGVLMRLFQGRGAINFKYPAYTRVSIGVDNFYCGRLDSMHSLVKDFHENLDTIAAQYPAVQIHEQLVYEHAKSKGYCR